LNLSPSLKMEVTDTFPPKRLWTQPDYTALHPRIQQFSGFRWWYILVTHGITGLLYFFHRLVF
jgi:hypothetical protein